MAAINSFSVDSAAGTATANVTPGPGETIQAVILEHEVNGIFVTVGEMLSVGQNNYELDDPSYVANDTYRVVVTYCKDETQTTTAS